MAIGRTLALVLWPLLAIAGEERPAQTFTVDSTLDEPDVDTNDGACRSASGVCTLRAAVMQANVLTGPSVIINVPAGTYTITQPVDGGNLGSGGSLYLGPALDGLTPILILGESTATTIVDGGQIDRVFTVAAARTATFDNLTVRNGYVGTNVGGGIFNKGALTLDHVALIGNYALGGGGVYSDLDSTLHVFSSSIMNNTADLGGGLFTGGPCDITGSTIASNAGSTGGGVDLFGPSILLNTTIAGNSASENGGGLVVSNNVFVNIYNSTIAFNVADSDGNNDGSGGGVYLDTNGLNIYNTLIAGNYHINPAFADASVYNSG